MENFLYIALFVFILVVFRTAMNNGYSMLADVLCAAGWVLFFRYVIF